MPTPTYYGVYPALVTDLKDPDGQGRVNITLPSLNVSGDNPYSAWARLATLMAGKGRGTFFIPEVGDEVLVAFEAGDPAHPYVVGALWNGTDSPPESMDGAGRNRKKIIRSRNGVKLTISDEDHQESFTVETPGGQKLVLRDDGTRVEIADSLGNSVKFDTGGIVIAGTKVQCVATSLSISASSVEINTGKARFSGQLQCDTLVANSVVAQSYTPGAGNIM